MVPVYSTMKTKIQRCSKDSELDCSLNRVGKIMIKKNKIRFFFASFDFLKICL